jgi:hypothetical protein
MDLLLTRREARLLLAALIAVFALAAVPASAIAGSVKVEGGVLTYADPGDVTNAVTIASDGTSYTVTDPSGVTPDTGCAAGGDATQATCPVADVTSRIVVNLGPGDDSALLDSSVTMSATIAGQAGNDTITGGAGADSLAGADGDDVINSVDGVVDDLFCGPGTDHFTADPGDRLNPPTSCEDDNVPPAVQITSGPPDLSGSRSATFEFSSGDPNLDHFECIVDGAAPALCGTPASYNLDRDGAHTFTVQGVDRFGHVGPPATPYQWTIDVGAPNINIDSAPSGTIHTSTATFSFSSPDSDLKRFDCRIDGSDWVECTSPITLSFLPDGPHTFGVRAVDKAGNVGVLTLSFTVALPAGVVSRPSNSLVLIAGNTVKVTKRGYAYIALNCSGTKDCAGKVLLDTSKKVRSGRRKRIVRLGHAKFQIRATRTRRVRIHISRRKMRLLRKLRKVNTDIIVRDLDGAGRARVSSRTIVLRAPRR